MQQTMGVIEDGTIKGKLPSEEVFAVHYPGYPSSMSLAVETLGGLDVIAKAHNSEANKLELRFRPGDPFSHPAFGHIRPCNSLLLKISKRNVGDNQNDSCQSKTCDSTCNLVQSGCSVSVLSADIVARVQEAYHFNGMVDYQHVIPVHANAGRMSEMKGPVDTENFGDVDDDCPMILVPPLFSPKDVPENIVLRPSTTLSSKKKQEGVVQHRWEMEIEPCLAIDFNISEIPKNVNWEQYIPKDSEQWKLQMAVSKFFAERPIWPRNSIFERLGNMGLKVGDHTLRRLLFRSAYYFGSGPFHRFWIRKGYDPRKDPESRIYQRMIFRVPPPLRGYCDATKGLKHKWEDMCAFRVFPYKCQTYFQLFELVDDYIQEEIPRFPYLAVCSRSTGWFSSSALDNIRLRVALRFISVYPQGGAETFVKSISDKFEKSKNQRFVVIEPKLGEDRESVVNQEPSREEDKSEDINDDEVDEEDEEESDFEDEVVDEMDLDDPTYLDGADPDFSLQSCSNLGAENISKSYLQELFGSFPTAEGAPNQLHGVDSEAEYQIYEQDSDGNNSDDDY
ncbi:uncharacterized protein LOC141643783 [Silene latifolia]|uniref:uncharacterized protein LOC141643783 n=1 Tax=Silene latifolia TaxID=37657 RepID=UPI003D77D943